MNKSRVVACLTMTKQNGRKIIVEVHDDAGFSNFYNWYSREGRKHKVFRRVSHRSDGIEPWYMQSQVPPSLERLAETTQKHAEKLAGHRSSYHEITMAWADERIVDIKIKVLSRKKYLRLLSCPADELPGGMTKIQHWDPHTTYGRILPNARVTDEYRRLQERRAEIFGWDEKAGVK